MIKAFIIFATLLSGAAKENYQVSTAESSVKWVGKKVTGQHDGTVSLKNGELIYEGNKLVGGNFTIDMQTIECTDLSGDSKKNLDGHLKSDDFFGVKNYPTASLTIIRAVPQGPNKYKVVANITIKGTTEEIQFPASVENTNGKIVASASFSIDRSKFNVRYGSGSFFDNLGDKTIYDDFDMEVKLVANK